MSSEISELRLITSELTTLLKLQITNKKKRRTRCQQPSSLVINLIPDAKPMDGQTNQRFYSTSSIKDNILETKTTASRPTLGCPSSPPQAKWKTTTASTVSIYNDKTRQEEMLSTRGMVENNYVESQSDKSFVSHSRKNLTLERGAVMSFPNAISKGNKGISIILLIYE